MKVCIHNYVYQVVVFSALTGMLLFTEKTVDAAEDRAARFGYEVILVVE